MLRQLSIRNFLLIHRLDLDFEAGLTVLTGETGAGKSILLEALGFCLGGRSQSQWVQEEQAEKLTVAATFEIHSSTIKNLLEEADIEDNPEEPDLLILRRSMSPDGRTRPFVNDQPVSVSLLKTLGERLIEVHGQFDRFLDASSQRTVLDYYGALTPELDKVSRAFEKWQETLNKLDNVRKAQQVGAERLAYLKLVVEELMDLSPEKGEEERLSTVRARLANRVKLEGALTTALSSLRGEAGIEPSAVKTYRVLDKVSDMMGEEIKPTLEALDRILVEATDVSQSLEESLYALRGGDVLSLDEVENRLFLLRSMARKLMCPIDILADKLEDFSQELSSIEGADEQLEILEAEAEHDRFSYHDVAGILREKRQIVAISLGTSLQAELPPLKLERAAFRVNLEQQDEIHWNSTGQDRVVFQVCTNVGMPWGDLGKVASGGERSRFMLALKSVLAQYQKIGTMIFDEIDAGVSGSVAAAVGERLHRLSLSGGQILAITHSPQVAGQAEHHWIVEKNTKDGQTRTRVRPLSKNEREEEVARLLAGHNISEEARLAARQLMNVAKNQEKGAEG